MPLRNQLPPSSRYSSKTRSRSLGRPAFWGAVIFLPVVGLVTWQYLVDPDLLGSLLQKAEINSSPLPSKEFKQSGTSFSAPIAPNQETEATKTKELYQDYLAQKQATFSPDTQPSPLTETGKPAATLPSVVDTPLLVQAKNLLQASPLVPNSTAQNQSVVPLSPVQPGLSQSAAANPASTLSAPQASTRALGQSLPTNSLPNQTSQLTTPSSAGTGYTPPTATNTTPARNSYAYSVPPRAVQPQSVIRVIPYSALVAPPVTPGPPTTNIAPYSVQVQQPSVTAPRPIPGRYGSREEINNLR